MQRWLGKVLGVTLIIVSFSVGWQLMNLQQFLDAPLQLHDGELEYDVAPGVGLIAVANDLHRRGILERPRYLVWYARWEGKADQVQTGRYRLSPGMTPVQLLDKLVTGDVIQYALTIPEGWTFRQLRAAVDADPKLVHQLGTDSDDELMERIGHPGVHPEGRFFPDTYYFTAGTTDADFLRRAFTAMDKRLAEEWQDRTPGLPYRSPYEALIMASIIERETAVPAERGQIAGVFVRRLRRGMRLQTDPTVIYGMGAAFDGNLRRRDLLADTPYNTYRHAGLPPTPIALPGADAIHAALHPAPGDSLYFVARGDGTHHFSSTIAEHNEAVRKYQLGRK